MGSYNKSGCLEFRWMCEDFWFFARVVDIFFLSWLVYLQRTCHCSCNLGIWMWIACSVRARASCSGTLDLTLNKLCFGQEQRGKIYSALVFWLMLHSTCRVQQWPGLLNCEAEGWSQIKAPG